MLGHAFSAGRAPQRRVADRPGDDECTTEAYYVRMVHAAIDAGVNLFDSANSYHRWGQGLMITGTVVTAAGAIWFGLD